MNIFNKKKFIIDLVFYVIIFALLFLFIKYILIYLLPFIVGGIFAILVQPIGNILCKKIKLKRKILNIILVIFLWIILGLILSFLIIALYNQLTAFSLNTDLINNFKQIAEEFLYNISLKLNITIPKLNIDSLSGLTAKALSFLTNIIKTAPGIFIFILVSILASVFIAGDFDLIKNSLKNILNDKQYSRLIYIKNFAFNTSGKIIRAYILILLITFTELLAGLFVLRIEYAFLLSIIIAVFDLLPYVGCSTVLLPWAIIEICLGSKFKALGLIVIAVIITIVRNYLEPRLIGDQTNTHPLLILISVYIGGKIFGITGILFLPLATMFLIRILKENNILNIKKHSQN